MSSEHIQPKLVAQRLSSPSLSSSGLKPANNSLALNRRKGTFELTRDQDFLSGNDDIFDVLARHSAEKNHWDTRMNATLKSLERARSMLSEAEKTIRDLSEKLRYLEDVSGICALTGLLNHRGFTRALNKEISRTNRGLSQGGLLVMFNLENLSRIESAHGEKAGETTLRLVARALETEIRGMDSAAHIQKDEFVLLFADTNLELALTRLQNMALRLNKLSLIWDKNEINLNLSLGLKTYNPGDLADQIFKSANDDLMRNRKGSARI